MSYAREGIWCSSSLDERIKWVHLQCCMTFLMRFGRSAFKYVFIGHLLDIPESLSIYPAFTSPSVGGIGRSTNEKGVFKASV